MLHIDLLVNLKTFGTIFPTAYSKREYNSLGQRINFTILYCIIFCKTVKTTKKLFLYLGKRQAKKYLRKALSFGVKSGYLIPTDSEGQVIRVAPTLMDTKKSNAESRKRRRRARRGEDDPLIGSKDRCPTPPWKIKKREDTPKSQENPLQKRGKSSSLKKSPIRRKKIEKRPSRRSRRKMTRRKLVI